MNFKQQLRNIYLTWGLVIVLHFILMFFKSDIILINSDLFFALQIILNVITIIVSMYALYILFSMIKHFSSCISMMEHGSVIVARKEYNGAQPSELKPGNLIVALILNIAGIFCAVELITGMHTEIYIGSRLLDNRNQATMYLCMVIVSVLFVDVIAIFRFLAHMKEKNLLKKRFTVLENNIQTLSKTVKISDVSVVINDFKQIAVNNLIIQKLEEIEKQIDVYSMKKESFEGLFRLKELDWEKQIRESLYETEKALVNNCYNMLFAVKSLEGACLQDASDESFTFSSDSLDEINRNFKDNIQANNEMFDDLNLLFAQTATTYNKVSTASLDVDGTIKAMEMNAAMNNAKSSSVSININKIINEMYDSENNDKKS